jgi:hypothetical protein
MGSWADWTSGLSAILSGGISLVAPQIEQATGWDLNANHSPVFSQGVVPVANIVGGIMGYGPAGDYLSGTAQAIAGKVPLPVAWTGGEKPANWLDTLTQAPAPIIRQLPGTAAASAAQVAVGALARKGWPRYYARGGR